MHSTFPVAVHVFLLRGEEAKDERVDFFLACWLGSEEAQNREPERCSQLVWARLSRLPDDTIPYVRTAIENFQKRIWFQEFGWKKGTT